MYKILESIAPLYGFCPFDEIKDNLIDCRAKSRLPEGTESIIIFAFPYLLPAEKYEGSNISKYAVSADYHGLVMERLRAGADKLSALYPNESFACFADNSPIPEVRCACIAGLGVRGSNSLLITEKYGSFVFLGEIVTTLKINCTPREINSCINCGRCTAACPGKALDGGRVEKDRCLSHITQKKGELTENEIKLMKECGCVWGCDVCQNVCPMNKNASEGMPEFALSAVPVVTEATPIEGRAYAWRGEKTIRRNIELMDT